MTAQKAVASPGLPAPGRTRLGPPALDSFVGEPDRQAATLAQAGVIRAPVDNLVLLLGDVAAAVLVQLERQDGHPGVGGGTNLLHCSGCGTTGRIHATMPPAKLPYQAPHGSLMRWTEIPNDAQQGSRTSDLVVADGAGRNPC